MLRKLPAAGQRDRRPWSADDLAALRDHLKSGTSLINTARVLRRDTDDVERKIAELFQPGQSLRRPPQGARL
jgi:hypothetical protein